MFDIRELNIAFELWGVALCVLGNACLLLFSRSEGSYRRIIFTMFTLELIAAGGDAVAGIFRGRSGFIAWQATHLGNFATFSANFFLLAVFTSYLCERMREVGATHVRRWRAGALVVAAVMSLLTALGTFYTIDAANLYHRSDLYWMTYAYALVLGLVDFFLLMRSRKDLERSSFWCLLFYIVAPLLAMSVQVCVYGLNFLIIASVIGTVVLFCTMKWYWALACALLLMPAPMMAYAWFEQVRRCTSSWRYLSNRRIRKMKNDLTEDLKTI